MAQVRRVELISVEDLRDKTMRHPTPHTPTTDLGELLSSVPGASRTSGLGQDIDEANAVLLDPAIPEDRKIARFRQWASRFQPCMFGRLGAKNLAGIRYDICWINREDLRQGSLFVKNKIQQARSAWKARAAEGRSHGFLIMFNAPELVCLKPGPKLIEVCLALSNLYLIEHAPVQVDTIYAESIPFHAPDGSILCLKGGINLFYSSAHRTRNHDRRVPAGLMISVNSPGLLAHSLVKHGQATDLRAALETVRALAWASIGNGGLTRGQRGEHSCSWHNIDKDRPSGQCPMKHRPSHVPNNFAADHYSALYHTDVLVPSQAMGDPSLDRARTAYEAWTHLDLAYLSAPEPPTDHENFGFVHGLHVTQDTKFQHTWAPLPAPTPSTEESPL
jgi:hypothetical protein